MSTPRARWCDIDSLIFLARRDARFHAINVKTRRISSMTFKDPSASVMSFLSVSSDKQFTPGPAFVKIDTVV